MNFKRLGFFVGMALWGWTGLLAQQVHIWGSQAEYSGASIEFTIPGNPFMEKALYSESILCDDSGSFQLELEVESEVSILIRTGIYEGSLYIEPGSSYHVILPPYREASHAEKISPYFEALQLPLRISGNPDDMNMRMQKFDSLFYLYNEELIQSRRQGGRLLADSLIGLLESNYKSGPPDWFSLHRQYREGMLKLNEGRTGLEEIGRDYLGEVVREKHPAFMDLFGAMFKDFLVYYNRTGEGKGIRNSINRLHNLDSLRTIVSSHPAVSNDTIRDFILLQELPPLFYHGEFHKEAILILLDSLVSDPVRPAFGNYAAELREKLASLLAGYPPPRFDLKDEDGTVWTPSDFKGKYTYLMFCTPDHYGCMMEYPFLNSYVNKHSEYLEVVCIMVAEYPTQVGAFMERNKYRWRALYYGGDTRILDDYLVRAFPVAYLLGPDGNIILSPAPLPSDGFEQQLFRIMRSRGDI